MAKCWAQASLYDEKTDEKEAALGESSGWEEHVAYAKSLVEGDLVLGRPPEDLLQVLTMIALGGPGVVALRSLGRFGPPDSVSDFLARTYAGEISMSFISFFNRPESLAVIDRETRSKSGPYWKRVLGYCAEGCLSSVIDEYAHLVIEESGLLKQAPGESEEETLVQKVAKTVHGKVKDVLSLKTTTPEYDEIQLEEDHLKLLHPHLVQL